MLVTILFICLVFLGMPLIIERETGKLRSEIQDLKTKMQTLEKFKSNQENAWKMTGLKPGDDFRKVIKSVNNLSSKIASMEDYVAYNVSAVENKIEDQAKANKDLIVKQSETINKFNEDITVISRKIYLNAITMSITAHIFEAKIELVSRNIGNVKAALQAISNNLQKAKDIVEDKNKKTFDDLNTIVGNIKSELDVSLPGANNMINLLWYELEKTADTL